MADPLERSSHAIVHGDLLANGDDLWYHEGHHQLCHIHDRLIAVLRRIISDHIGDDLLRLVMAERVFPRIAQGIVEDMRNAREEADSGGDHQESS